MGVDDFLRWLGAATLVAGAVWAGLSMVSRVTARIRHPPCLLLSPALR